MHNPVDIRSFVTAETIDKLSARNMDKAFFFMDNKFADEYDANNVDKQQSVKDWIYIYAIHRFVSDYCSVSI
jgi:CO dehydrogenase nickel-insertion accessory protein CooC1